jgi:hypothetical protein
VVFATRIGPEFFIKTGCNHAQVISISINFRHDISIRPVMGTQRLLLVLSMVIVVPVLHVFTAALVTSIEVGIELLPATS